MYLRVNLQQRTMDNLDWLVENYKEKENLKKDVVIKGGYVLSLKLKEYTKYVRNTGILNSAIVKSESKDSVGHPCNLNLSEAAKQSFDELKCFLDKEAGRSFYPAQVLDIFIICIRDKEERGVEDGAEEAGTEVSEERLAKALLDYSYWLLTSGEKERKLENRNSELIKALQGSKFLP